MEYYYLNKKKNRTENKTKTSSLIKISPSSYVPLSIYIYLPVCTCISIYQFSTEQTQIHEWMEKSNNIAGIHVYYEDDHLKIII